MRETDNAYMHTLFRGVQMSILYLFIYSANDGQWNRFVSSNCELCFGALSFKLLRFFMLLK